MTTENLSPARETGPVWPPAAESFLDRPGNARLFTRSARPAGAARATVVLTHGHGEHSSRYGHVAAALVARGLHVVGWDLRGHGRSSGPRGDIEDYGCLIEDLAAVCAHHRAPREPLFLFAHSLGGQITLRFLEEKTVDCVGAVVASPWLRLSYVPPWWKLALARLAMRCWPAFPQSTGPRWERLSRDWSHLTSFPDLELVHHTISARMFFAVREAGERVLAAASALRLPLLLLHGDADPITCHRATAELFEHAAATDKTLRIYPGTRHETHNDLDRAQVIREVADWIEARLDPGR